MGNAMQRLNPQTLAPQTMAGHFPCAHSCSAHASLQNLCCPHFQARVALAVTRTRRAQNVAAARRSTAAPVARRAHAASGNGQNGRSRCRARFAAHAAHAPTVFVRCAPGAGALDSRQRPNRRRRAPRQAPVPRVGTAPEFPAPIAQMARCGQRALRACHVASSLALKIFSAKRSPCFAKLARMRRMSQMSVPMP